MTNNREANEFLDYVESLNLYNQNEKYNKLETEKTIISKITKGIIDLIGGTPFINAIVNSYSNQEAGNSPQARALSFFVMVISIFMIVVVCFAVGRVLQMIIGNEIVVEQEVIIIENVKVSELRKLSKESTNLNKRNISERRKKQTKK